VEKAKFVVNYELISKPHFMKIKIFTTLSLAIITIFGFASEYNILSLSTSIHEIIKEIIFKCMLFGGSSALVIIETYWTINGLKEKKVKNELIRRFEIFQRTYDGIFLDQEAMVDTELKNYFTFKELMVLKKLKYIRIKNIDFENL
jgi:hypothetical protein